MASKKPAKPFSAIVVFADGACTGNPGPGGWGVVIATPAGEVTELGGGEPDTTNNRMEMAAVGKALRHLENTPGTVAVYTDSVYVINGLTKWVWGWRSRDWKTAEGKDVANVEYWKALMGLLGRRGKENPVEFHYVRGHAGVPGNERVDAIAVAFAKGARIALYRGPLVGYEVPIYDIPDNTDVPERKSSDAKGAAKKEPYSYLSLVGRTVERHKTWKECERRVKGVPGAKFKKCASAEEESAVLKSWGVEPP